MSKKLTVILIIVILLVSAGCRSNKEVVTEYDFTAASSIEILQATVDQMANGNCDLLGQYMQSGDYIALNQGTKIRILETRDDKYIKFLVLDGKRANKEFWTFVVFLDYGSADIPFDLVITKQD